MNEFRATSPESLEAGGDELALRAKSLSGRVERPGRSLRETLGVGIRSLFADDKVSAAIRELPIPEQMRLDMP